MANSDSVYSEEHDRVNRSDDQQTKKEIKSLQDKMDLLLSNQAKQEQMNFVGGPSQEVPPKVNEVDGLEGQEELCFINANGTWYMKEPNFQYQNNYQQRPYYNNQQGGYQANQSPQIQGSSSQAQAPDLSVDSMFKQLLEFQARNEKTMIYEFKNIHVKIDGNYSDLNNKHVARVAWETVTSPKAEGVWVAWIQDNVIKDSCLWEMKEKQTHTWLFKKLLRLRAEATQWIRITPGNGCSISIWHSPWSPFGPLLQRFGSHGPRHSGIPLSSSLSTLWNGSSWILSSARSLLMEQVHIHLSTITLSDSPDFPIWNSAGIGANNNNKFVISKIYDSIRDSRPKVFWNKAVWFSKGIPKHKTLTWLFLLNRCPTRDRLLSWGLQTDPSCLLCNNHPESRNHIFFDCSFTRSIWRPLSRKIGLTSPSDSWDDTARAVTNFTEEMWLAVCATVIGGTIMLTTIGAMCYCVIMHRVEESKLKSIRKERSKSQSFSMSRMPSDSEILNGEYNKRMYAL
ncbi:hypothetical protein F2Q68_00024701 [Brassica cretica]|uniref:Reverse transcriptase zinc-binding domain-containing protein n=1 Tax=Brassica cretica TaxID=69181 RepID=A0A8S9IGB0_BRACR|nr:hypothetical protein F2Q68_00024701 [Brassica cretica]